MGLDMYLKAERYVSGFDFSTPESKQAYDHAVQAMGFPAGWKYEHSPSAEISLTVAYWRKANQIHAWFVDNCQNGKDNCAAYSVSREQLAELIELCQAVLENPQKGPELLPAQPGFFFGSTEYGECYLEDLADTVKQLRAILDNPAFEDCDFQYQASW